MLKSQNFYWSSVKKLPSPPPTSFQHWVEQRAEALLSPVIARSPRFDKIVKLRRANMAPLPRDPNLNDGFWTYLEWILEASVELQNDPQRLTQLSLESWKDTSLFLTSRWDWEADGIFRIRSAGEQDLLHTIPLHHDNIRWVRTGWRLPLTSNLQFENEWLRCGFFGVGPADFDLPGEVTAFQIGLRAKLGSSNQLKSNHQTKQKSIAFSLNVWFKLAFWMRFRN